MKRMRDDRPFVITPMKRPSFHGQSSVSGPRRGDGGSQKFTISDATNYVILVKDTFQGQEEKYEAFLQVLRDLRAERIDTAGVIARVKELFRGHNNLISVFNIFLPEGYEITIDEDEPPLKKTTQFEEAVSFVIKIKKRFRNDQEHVYKSFLDLLSDYRKGNEDLKTVCDEVAILFHNHPDLLDEFTRSFLSAS